MSQYKMMGNNNNMPRIGIVMSSLLVYWIVLVLWQSINPGKSGSTIDMLIKTALFLFLLVRLFRTEFHVNYKTIVVFVLFFFNMMISFFMDSSHNFRSVLTYFFPVFLLLLIICMNGDETINKSQLLMFLKIIIAFVAYMAIYALIFMPQKFVSALTLTNAYGNELSSFFVSNHEYALYLTAGIISCLICLKFEGREKRIWYWVYYLFLALFSINIILTFSRTYLLATLVFVSIYMLFNKQRKLTIIYFVVLCMFLGILIWIPSLRAFVFQIVLKRNTLAGRDDLSNLAINLFDKSQLMEKIWGMGAGDASAYFAQTLNHSSVHNSYLQVLLHFGLSNFILMIIFLISRFTSACKIVRIDRFAGVFCCGMLISSIVAMAFNTSLIFTSPCDSFFMTMFFVILPKYVGNAIYLNRFYD